jgi:hypothetical protein
MHDSGRIAQKRADDPRLDTRPPPIGIMYVRSVVVKMLGRWNGPCQAKVCPWRRACRNPHSARITTARGLSAVVGQVEKRESARRHPCSIRAFSH